MAIILNKAYTSRPMIRIENAKRDRNKDAFDILPIPVIKDGTL